jgi:hypothetical protein
LDTSGSGGKQNIFNGRKAALLLPSYNTIEDLILPYTILDMKTFQFKVSTERGVWTNQAEFKSFDTDTYRTRTNPVFLTPFEDMDPLQKVKDDECRDLAVSFLEDIERSRNVMSEENIRELVRDFGFFNAIGDNIEDYLHHSKITEYVLARFTVLRAIGF